MKSLIPLLVLLLAFPLTAQEHTRSSSRAIDPDDQYWDAQFGANAITGEYYSGVNALARSRGFLYAGGWFTHAGGVRANNIARYDGDRWVPVISGNDTGLNNGVKALASIGNDLYAGGSFDSAGGVRTGAVARWDGTNWYRVGEGLKGDVSVLTVIDGDLYAGGTFGIGEFGATGHVARWDGATWNLVGDEVNGNVMAISPSSSGLVIGGSFDTAGGIRTGPVARYSSRAKSWAPIGNELRDTLSGGASVWALLADGDDLYVGGRFDMAGNTGLSNIARLNGSQWEPLGDGVYEGYAMLPMVLSLTATPTSIYAGGTFGKAGGRETGFIARWDRASSTWHPLGSGVGDCDGFECNPAVTALLPEGVDLYVGGNFRIAGGKPSLKVALWSEPTPGTVPGANHDAVARSLAFSPAPFTGTTVITFTLAERSTVRLVMTDITGRDIALLVDGTLSAGAHHSIWDASGLPAGVYLCRIEVGGQVVVGKVVKE
jgi:hypothetical protein